MTSNHTKPRTIDQVDDNLHIGQTATSDDSTLLIAPGDPTRTDPFLVMGEERFSSPGFDWHPHRGMETVTLILDGVLEHGDSQGNAGLLQPGDVQWMTAGRGIIHRELAARDEYAHILQLWVNLPAGRKLTDSRYQDIRAGTQAIRTEPGAIVQVISGSTGGATGPALNHWPILGLMLILEPNTTYRQVVGAEERAFAHVISGRVAIGGREIQAGQVAWSHPVPGQPGPTSLTFTTPDAGEPTRIMFFAGRPIGEPVVAGGPFIMNSRAEIAQAYRDFHAGKLGSIPRHTRLVGG